jgi:hypothetical protein
MPHAAPIEPAFSAREESARTDSQEPSHAPSYEPASPVHEQNTLAAADHAPVRESTWEDHTTRVEPQHPVAASAPEVAAPMVAADPIVMPQHSHTAPTISAAEPASPLPPVLSLDEAGLVMIETRSDAASQPAAEPTPQLGRSRRVHAPIADEPLVQVETQK